MDRSVLYSQFSQVGLSRSNVWQIHGLMGNSEMWLMKKGLEAANIVKTLWIVM